PTSSHPPAPPPHPPRYVLELPLARILEDDIEPAMHIFFYPTRNANATRFREGLQACRDVHAIAPHVVAVANDIADIDTHTEFDPFLLRHVGVALDHGALDIDGTTYCG